VTTSQFGLFGIVLLIPVAGFVLTILYARKGDTRLEQRWRKRHGLLFWCAAPAIAGAVTIGATVEAIPPIFSIVGVAILGLTTFLSWSLQTRHEERDTGRT